MRSSCPPDLFRCFGFWQRTGRCACALQRFRHKNHLVVVEKRSNFRLKYLFFGHRKHSWRRHKVTSKKTPGIVATDAAADVLISHQTHLGFVATNSREFSWGLRKNIQRFDCYKCWNTSWSSHTDCNSTAILFSIRHITFDIYKCERISG